MNHKLHGYCTTCHVQVELKENGAYGKRRPANGCIAPYDPSDVPWIMEEYILCSCPKCESPFLFKREWYEIPAMFETVTSEPELLYPSTHRLPISSLPKSIGKPYRDAVRSYEFGLFEPCLIMCRKCLEALCYEHSVSRGNLKKKLNTLKERGVIDTKLHSWTDSLRLIGNDVAHELDIEIHPQDAKDALEFVEATISYIFILGQKFHDFELRRQRNEEEKNLATG